MYFKPMGRVKFNLGVGVGMKEAKENYIILEEEHFSCF
jgi:hypothetical protein